MPDQPAVDRRRWSPGDTVVFRYVAHDDSIAQAVPTRVIEHRDDLLALHIPDGALIRSLPDVPLEDRAAALDTLPPPARRPRVERPWNNHCIRLHLPGEHFSVWLLFGPDWKFNWWYGNLEAPYVDTPIGIDTRDHALDVAARPDGRWWWKDEEEFARRLELGIDSAVHQAAVRAAGEEFIRRFEATSHPFDGDWPSWRPTEGIPPPRLPSNWDEDFGTPAILPRTDR